MARASSLANSPCYTCECKAECENKINRSPKLGAIYDTMFYSNAPKKDCGIYIAINADPDVVVAQLCGNE